MLAVASAIAVGADSICVSFRSGAKPLAHYAVARALLAAPSSAAPIELDVAPPFAKDVLERLAAFLTSA